MSWPNFFVKNRFHVVDKYFTVPISFPSVAIKSQEWEDIPLASKQRKEGKKENTVYIYTHKQARMVFYLVGLFIYLIHWFKAHVRTNKLNP
jgi:hypothetical protein